MKRTFKEFLRDLFESITHIKRTFKNIRLCKRYPFLKPRNVWSDEIIHNCYNRTLFDDIPCGWRKVFGKQLCEELREELIKYNYLKEYRILQIKEKYGTLHIYDNGTPKESKIYDILNKYEDLSMCYCIYCGKHVRYVSEGWINYLCEDCAKEIHGCERLTLNYVPKRIIYADNVKATLESEIDFKTMWDIKEDKISYKLPIDCDMYDMCYCASNCKQDCARRNLPQDGIITMSDFTNVCKDYKEKEE